MLIPSRSVHVPRRYGSSQRPSTSNTDSGFQNGERFGTVANAINSATSRPNGAYSSPNNGYKRPNRPFSNYGVAGTLQGEEDIDYPFGDGGNIGSGTIGGLDNPPRGSLLQRQKVKKTNVFSKIL